MASADYYRAEAKRCRDLAAHSVSGSAMADQWLRIAAEYETLAEALGGPPVRTQPQQQPMQQQQQKTTEDEK
jgi:hypothetical protein